MHSRFIKDAAGGEKVVTIVIHVSAFAALTPTQFVEVLPLPYGPARAERVDLHASGEPCCAPFAATDP